MAPGTLASAAALTFAATSAESACCCGRLPGVGDAAGLAAAPANARRSRPRAATAATAAAPLRTVLSMDAPPLFGVGSGWSSGQAAAAAQAGGQPAEQQDEAGGGEARADLAPDPLGADLRAELLVDAVELPGVDGLGE